MHTHTRIEEESEAHKEPSSFSLFPLSYGQRDKEEGGENETERDTPIGK